MHLKRITVQGFKSFADKISLTFDRGITGVVGPNGSGKSNIIDAVRWVMGEQNAKNLRGEKATDIIFAGSERRKTMSMAEVSLTFDNTEGASICPPEYRHEPEITLTRRLYIDGQREYLINRKACRLKDIVGFFALTGLGGRSYSMIQQGQVDRILNAKPEDVREILEEAAGTLIYKTRKIEAQKRLEATALNLSRVTDILTEIERQKTSLEEQVEKAQKWQEMSGRLRDEELLLLAHNFTLFKNKLDEAQSALAEQTTKEAEFLAAVSQYESRFEELQQQLAEADPELAAVVEQISSIREEIARAESAVGNAQTRMDTGANRLRDIHREIEEDASNLKVIEAQVDGATTELSNADKTATVLRGQLEAFQDEVDMVDESARVFRGKIEDGEDELRNLTRLIDSNKVRSEAAQREISRAEKGLAAETSRRENLQSDVAQATATFEGARDKAGGQQEGLDVEIREKHAREAAVAAQYAQMKAANTTRDTLREKYHESRARLTSLQELDEQGATDAASSLQKLFDAGSIDRDQVPGLFAQLIAWTANAQELPKPAAQGFERWSERLVITSIDGLNQVVRAAAKAEVTPLPVTLLGRSVALKSDSAFGALVRTWADNFDAVSMSEFLRLDSKNTQGALSPQAKSGLEALLHRLYFVPALAMDDSSLKEMPSGVIAFTAQGLCITGEDDFLVSGRGGVSVLSRKSEQESLAKNLKEVEGDLARAQSLIDGLEVRINEDRGVITEIDGRLQKQNSSVLAIMAELQSAQQVAVHKQELLAAQEQTTADLERQNAQFRAELTSLESSRSALEEELRNAGAELANIREEASGLEERREEVFRQNRSRSVDLAKSEARATALRESFIHARAQQELLQNKLSRRYEEQAALQNDIESAKNQFEHSQSRIEGMIGQRAALDEKVAERREAQAGIHEELRVIDSRLKETREYQAKVQKSLSDKNVQIERATMAITSVNAQAQEKYQLDIATYTFTYDPEFEADKIARSVGSLRGRIDSLGPINMMALKEFEELTSREDFIRTQQDEINSSIALLNEAIGEIEISSKDKFLATFTVVNREFGQLFPILFPNGEGQLQLTNPEDPLNGGVEIMVRLPGKKPQNMNLFSGGEKALTAISLIFALLKSKPTPFCFLDEVDAPLDEANVGRYNRVLDALSDQFQFIIITHNRRTMEVLDTLYGVTMQEPGVSSIVGVDMKKDLPTHLKKAFKDEPKKSPEITGASLAIEAAALDDSFDPEGPVPVPHEDDGRSFEGASSR